MPRSARLHYPGGTYHIISRCMKREWLINDEEDRGHYLDLVERTLTRVDAQVLGYCLMSNHVHLVVRAGHDRLDRLIKPVHSGFAVRKNHRDARIGPVFAARYKAVLVEEEAYLLELMRYVHNNPVRAGHPVPVWRKRRPKVDGRAIEPVSGWTKRRRG